MTAATRDFLVEIGTEELPPRSLRRLGDAFVSGVADGLRDLGLLDSQATLSGFATPRRLAVRAQGVLVRQPDQASERRGPSVKAAFDAQGNPTAAAQGFADACGVPLDTLERLVTDKGEWLVHRATLAGASAAERLPAIVADALAALPVDRRMRWGDGVAGEFVRPVHWVLALLGGDVVPMRLYGCEAGRRSYGHRFLADGGAVEISSPADYEQQLEQVFVVAEFARRRQLIRTQLDQAARDAGGRVQLDEELLDEVTSLVEWPRALTGTFDPEFLDVAPEVLVATMRDHQKYFPLRDDAGLLLPGFITVTNIEAPDMSLIRSGNERVLRARFNDARFFWRRDLATPLDELVEATREITYQKALGSLHDKTRRVAALAAALMPATGAPDEILARAAALAKADLASAMVFEFTELQGVMGRHYALRAGEPEAVAVAIEEHYLPRFAGDRLPVTPAGICLALADRIDTLTGIFAIGAQPTGDRDPFALRRSALGVIRIALERGVDFDFDTMAAAAAAGLPTVPDDARVCELHRFVMERLRGHLAGQGYRADSIDAVLALDSLRLLDLLRRVEALESFRGHPDSDLLAAMDKRTRNILAKADAEPLPGPDVALLTDPAERDLAAALDSITGECAGLVSAGDYEPALTCAAGLAPRLTAFFDEVLVMAEESAVRRNRLALLAGVRSCLSAVADLSRLRS